MENKLDTYFKLYRALGRDTINKLNLFKGNMINGENAIEVIIISGESVDRISQIVNGIGGKYESLGYGYGIVTISVDKVAQLEDLDEIQYIELPKALYFSDINSNRAACIPEAQSSYSVDGEGVVVGFIDTGIDYMHPAFRNTDGTTRIEYIYDLSLGGVIYNKATINDAILNEDPSSIVPSIDLAEHGTHVAGIACAGGRIPVANYGVAPKSSIMMVKANRGRFALSTQILRGLKFLVDRSKELKMPLAVNISLSTNDGAHNGQSLLEKYISTVCDLERITIIIAAGNEGDASHHVGGELRGEQTISINIADDEPSVELALYHDILSAINVQITNPTGRVSGAMKIGQGLNEINLDGDRIVFYMSGPKPFDLLGEVVIAFISGGEYLIAGEWKISLNVLNEYRGNYDIWMPVSEGLNKNTKFLRPTLFNTLGIPATVSNVISVGSYNYITNTISSFSGRGAIGDPAYTKPELIAPGEGIISSVPYNNFDAKTGTSMAAPHVTGIAALFMQWGIVKDNDKFLYGERLKNYLVRGAKRDRPSVTYPNPLWGYGTVCAYNALEILRNEVGLPRVERGLEDLNRQEIRRKIIEYAGDIQKAIDAYPNAKVIILDENFAVITAPDNEIDKITSEVPEIVFVEQSPVYTLNDISPVYASNAPIFHRNPYLGLNGRGILVGILDTGIDYMNTEFTREDNKTRILSLWDQSIIDGVTESFAQYGIVYSEEQINNAISVGLGGGDPYSIVKSRDEIGHGTMVAGLAGARGKNPELVGAAPDCSFVIVKLKEASQAYLRNFGVTTPGVGRYENTDMILAIRYILNEARSRNMPVVIYIPVGTNIGSHDGTSIVERYIDDISKRRGLVVVTTTGNQGDADTHTVSTITATGDTATMELRVAPNQTELYFEIWINSPDKVSLSIVSPSGEIIEKIPAKLNQTEEIKFVFEGTRMFIQYSIPEEQTGDELIIIKAENLREGIWQFKLTGDYIVDGRCYSWIPQKDLLQEGTRFLNSNQYTTLTLPSTARRAISVAYYNQNNNATVGKSGRGYTRDGRIKPDIAAGGINAVVLSPGGGTKVASGSSIAGGVVAGCCAQLLQWGIVDRNDPTMYSVKMKTYLTRGAGKREGDVYPNREWGYGTIDMQGVFNNIRSRSYRSDIYDEFYVGNLFIRKPNDFTNEDEKA
ncbi:S8 family peptidase [Clostridium sardiniense]|uniref:S8 family peptidase n=1 Tax=Clostridium sardiniense TaxID=29369 RepID=UPI00311CC7A4|nr:subtilisin family serine protease [Clostridium sardiniense]